MLARQAREERAECLAVSTAAADSVRALQRAPLPTDQWRVLGIRRTFTGRAAAGRVLAVY